MSLLLVEAIVWHGLGAAFLFYYATLYPIERTAAVTHLSLLTILWGYVVCIRVAVWRLLPSQRGACVVNRIEVLQEAIARS